MADNIDLKDNADVELAPTECVMIKEEPDVDLEYDPSETNAIDNLEDDQEIDVGASGQTTVYHGTYLSEESNTTLKRKVDDNTQAGFPPLNKIYIFPVNTSPDVNPKPPPKKKQARTNRNSQPKTNHNEEDEENSLRIKYLINASETEERMRNLQMELHKARLEREKLELVNLKEMHHLQLENLKLEKELLVVKLKNVTDHGV